MFNVKGGIDICMVFKFDLCLVLVKVVVFLLLCNEKLLLLVCEVVDMFCSLWVVDFDDVGVIGCCYCC